VAEAVERGWREQPHIDAAADRLQVEDQRKAVHVSIRGKRRQVITQ